MGLPMSGVSRMLACSAVTRILKVGAGFSWAAAGSPAAIMAMARSAATTDDFGACRIFMMLYLGL
jgi:hypothetical protein